MAEGGDGEGRPESAVERGALLEDAIDGVDQRAFSAGST